MVLSDAGPSVTFDFLATYHDPKCIKVRTDQELTLIGVSSSHVASAQECGPATVIGAPRSAPFTARFSTAGLYGLYCVDHSQPGTLGAVMGLAILAEPAGGATDGGGADGGTADGGDVCQTAEPLPTDGGLLTGTTVGFANNYSAPGTGCAAARGGPDRVYSLEIPAGLQATVTAAPALGFDTSLSLVASPAATCDAAPRVCLASNDTGAGGVADVVRWLNGTPSAQTIFVIVDSTSVGGAYGIWASLAAPATGEVCQNAGTAITASTSLTGQTTAGFADNYSTANSTCGFSVMRGPDRAYAVTVPPMLQLTATALPAAGFDLGVDLVAGPAGQCEVAPRACLAGSDSAGRGAAESAAYVNLTSLPQSVYVIVDSFDPTEAGTFDLDLVIGTPTPPPVGDVCGTATVITASGTLSGQTTSGFNNDYAPTMAGFNCTNGMNPGRDRAYSVTLSAGQRVTVTATPVSTTPPRGDLSLYFIAGPASNCTQTPACLGGSDKGYEGAPETVTYLNSTGATQTVFLIVDSWYAMTPVNYSLQVNFTP